MEYDTSLTSALSPSRTISRRHFLKMALAAGTCLSSPSLVAAMVARTGVRTLSFYNTHTAERISTPYWVDGHYLREGLRRINWVLRDHRTDKIMPIHTSLLDLIFILQKRVDCRGHYEVISGYRCPETNNMLHRTSAGVALRSLHTQGKAIDIRLKGVALSDLRRAALTLRAGGVGYYPQSNFIHVDVGRLRSW